MRFQIAWFEEWNFTATRRTLLRKQAPKYKLVSTNIEHPDWRHAETVLPEQKDAMQYIVKSKDYLLAVYSDGIVGRAVAYHFSDGKATELSLPMTGAIDVIVPGQSHQPFHHYNFYVDVTPTLVRLRCRQPFITRRACSISTSLIRVSRI